MSDKDDLVALIGSRICHDLASPLGAIGNGIELMTLTGAGETPEMALIHESLANAQGRIRFFRIAFGAAEPGALVRAGDIAEALAGSERKAQVDWRVPGDLPRRDAKRVLLAVNCLDAAMPYGGTVTVTQAGDDLTITGTAERLRVEPELWSLLSAPAADPVAPARIQFALLPTEALAQGRRLTVDLDETQITIRV
ncbi:histidine phosphotransferase family protein [Maritimibacter sp. UBA3975]|uniref:histidine phosphotransferase family protein n=1 Tax=Maritimibacter sp. UBA3975 TaxID=1946833 RepID=UPI000C0AEB1A|nr:histidine phosphotransferase family protein [Maritimibacter sp. UBA3975]MAM61261.1 histidine phosphotransferase [Maritimibacter sp.]|tara:strand:+ start:1685 stop:2272 length:588 start_codon:yes stop_codon:yes gene_type:complete